MNIKLHAGSFLLADQTTLRHNFGIGNKFVSILHKGVFHLVEGGDDGDHRLVKIEMGEVVSCKKASEEDAVNMTSAAGLGVAGAVLLGPVGLLGGALLGGLNKKVTYIVEFKDGRRFLATSGMGTFKQIENTVLMADMK